MSANIFSKAVCYVLSIHTMGTERKVSKSSVQIKDNAGETLDTNSISADMRILESKEYDEIKALDRNIKKSISRLAIPSPLKEGAFIIPFTLIETTDRMVARYKQEREKLVEKFLAKVDELVEEDKVKFKAAFNPFKYPGKEEIKSKFSVDCYFESFGVPEELNNVNPEIFLREQKASAERLQKAEEEIKFALRETMLNLVNHMIQLLTPGPDGKVKQFRSPALANLSEFLETFKDRNILGDDELARIVTKAQKLTRNADAEMIRNEDSYRKTFQNSMDTLKKSMEPLVNVRTRKFNFDEV